MFFGEQEKTEQESLLAPQLEAMARPVQETGRDKSSTFPLFKREVKA